MECWRRGGKHGSFGVSVASRAKSLLRKVSFSLTEREVEAVFRFLVAFSGGLSSASISKSESPLNEAASWRFFDRETLLLDEFIFVFEAALAGGR
jgi:hypothetical protein